MNYNSNKEVNLFEEKDLKNEISTGSSNLNENLIHNKIKYFRTVCVHKNYYEINGNIFRIRKFKKKINGKGMLIRHTKLSCDNISRKIKSWVISDLIKFINKNYLKRKKIRFYIINKSVSYNTSIKFNNNLLDSPVEFILSKDISKKIKSKNFGLDNNKKIIEIIKENQNNEYKYNDIIEILNMNFFDCLKYYIGAGNEKITPLEGFESEYNKRKIPKSKYFQKLESFVINMKKYYSDLKFRIKMNNEMK